MFLTLQKDNKLKKTNMDNEKDKANSDFDFFDTRTPSIPAQEEEKLHGKSFFDKYYDPVPKINFRYYFQENEG